MRFILPPDRGTVRGAARGAVLAEWMTAWLGVPVSAELAPTYRELAVEIEAGRAELAWAPPAVCARLRAGARSVLTAVRDGASGCAAVLVVHRDSTIHSVADLAGKRAAWVDPLSASGYLLAVDHLLENGLDPDVALAEQSFAGSIRDALAAVAEKRADVTSLYVVGNDGGKTRKELSELVGPVAPRLRMLSRTASAPYDALVVGETALAGLEERILELSHGGFPPAMLLEVCRADRFCVADSDAYARFETFCERLLG